MDEAIETKVERHLVPFRPREVPIYRFDVLVLGSGAAGSSAALAAAESGASVGLLAKSDRRETNTLYAQGGLAAVLGPADSFESHVEDTLRVGCGIAEREAVERVVRGGPEAVDFLLRLGAAFDRSAEGGLDLSREGGHSHARILHAGDATGLQIQGALASGVTAHPSVYTFERAFAIDLLRADEGRVVGVLAQTERGEHVAFCASQVVLATGGAGQIFRETTNPVIATGDGLAMAFRAGAVLRDLEFVQFHPTCLYIAGAARVLISEIVRGAGGVLRDRDGKRFLADYHEAAELAPRDVVSRAVFERMVATHDTSVYLDLSGIPGNPHAMFPAISRVCRFFGIDIARDPVPVRPGAHYLIGGLRVDPDGRTEVPALWAVGECASSGLHGANRMGSNSLLEAIVLGTRAGRAAAAEAGEIPVDRLHEAAVRQPGPEARGVPVNIEDVTYSLKSLLWRNLGVVRHERQLEDALAKIDLWSRAVRELAPPGPRAWELLNMLTVARLATLCARARTESRGVHYRADHPERSDEWVAHTEISANGDEDVVRVIELRRVPLAESAPAETR